MVEVEGERVSGKNTNPERGASLVEYALLVALLCVVAVGGVRAVGAGVQHNLSYTGEQIGAGGFDPAAPTGPNAPEVDG
jgi:Flp pilus assembly pilin Flp